MILASLKTFWAGNATIQAALPVSKVYLDLVPEGTAFPYARITVLGGSPEYTTGGTHIETFEYQLAVYHSDFDALAAIGDTIEGQLNRSYPTAATMSHSKSNDTATCEIINGKYTYGLVIEYEWVYNSNAA